MEAALNVFGHCIQGFAYYYLLDHTVSSKFALCAWGAYDPKISCLERTCLVWGFPLLKLQMRTVFALANAEKQAERLRALVAMFDRVDAALANSGGPYIFGKFMSYVDVTFCALAAPLLGRTIVFTKPSQYANGRFRSFADADFTGYPVKLVELEALLSKRPCGELVVRMYADRKCHARSAS